MDKQEKKTSFWNSLSCQNCAISPCCNSQENPTIIQAPETKSIKTEKKVNFKDDQNKTNAQIKDQTESDSKDKLSSPLIELKLKKKSSKQLKIQKKEEDLDSQFKNLNNEMKHRIKLENVPDLERLLNQMKNVMGQKHFKFSTPHESAYKKRKNEVEALKEKQEKLKKEYADVYGRCCNIPAKLDNVKQIKEDVEKLKKLRNQTKPSSGVFTNLDEKNLDHLRYKIKDLEDKDIIKKRVEKQLKKVMKNQKHDELASVLAQANDIPFVNTDLMFEAKTLEKFLNPNTRIKDLNNAMKIKDVNMLKKSISDFEAAKIPRQFGLLKKAKMQLKELEELTYLNEILRLAIKSKNKLTMQKALDICRSRTINVRQLFLYEEVEIILFALQMPTTQEKKIKKKTKTKKPLKSGGPTPKDKCRPNDDTHITFPIGCFRDALLNMKKPQLDEIKRYSNPPVAVKVAMEGFFLMLGETKQFVASWPNIQRLVTNVGPNNIWRRIRKCFPKRINPQQRIQVEDHINDVNLRKVHKASVVVATFYAWVRLKCNRIDKQCFKNKIIE